MTYSLERNAGGGANRSFAAAAIHGLAFSPDGTRLAVAAQPPPLGQR